jgi:hypothetical protein
VLFVGDDWAEDHHDVEIVDSDGKRLGRARLPEGMTGMTRLHALIAEHLDEADLDSDTGMLAAGRVVVGIETDRGPWVAALLVAGYQVFAINPMSAARYRERHTTSGAKSDPGDAHVLAEIVPLDREHHRPVAGNSGEVEGLKLIARTHQSLIWDRTRQLQRLRQALREYYPGLLEALAAAKLELGDPDAWSPRFVHNDRLVDALGRQARAAISASSEVRAFYDHLRAAALGTGCAAPIRERSGRDSARLPGLRLVLRGGHRLAPRRRPGGRPDRDRRSSRPPGRAPWRTCLSGGAACAARPSTSRPPRPWIRLGPCGRVRHASAGSLHDLTCSDEPEPEDQSPKN